MIQAKFIDGCAQDVKIEMSKIHVVSCKAESMCLIKARAYGKSPVNYSFLKRISVLIVSTYH